VNAVDEIKERIIPAEVALARDSFVLKMKKRGGSQRPLPGRG